MNKLLTRLKELDNKLFVRAEEVYEAAGTKLARIVETFPHYTAHDVSHSLKTLEICEWLAGDQLLFQLNAPELFVLYSSILLHDVGMAVTPSDMDAIKSSTAYIEFEKSSGLSPTESLAEWIRRNHHSRSAKLIRETYSNPDGLEIRDKGLANAIALLCESHGLRDLNDFTKYDPHYAWGTSGLNLRIPLLAVLLRLSDILHVTGDRTPLAVLPYVNISNAKTMTEWSKHLSTVGVAPANGIVRISCICDDPNVHREILRLCDYINDEFKYCHQILNLLYNERHEDYALMFNRIEPSIRAEGYEPWLDLTFRLNREGIIRLITGERIYENPGAVVKELLMNAVDATRQCTNLSGTIKPISITLDTESRILTISDEGIGMDKTDLVTYLLDLGKCFYRSEDYENRFHPAQRIKSLSEFGIGFASCFLVSEHVVLETLKSGGEPLLLDMYDLMGFAAAKRCDRSRPGTSVTLHLKQDAVQNIESAVKNVKTICPHLEIPLKIKVNGTEIDATSPPFCFTSDELLVPFFRGREHDFIVEHRHFDPNTEFVGGCLGMHFTRQNGTMMPGSPMWYKLLQDKNNRQVSQLGFLLPQMQNWPSGLFREINNYAIHIDLNLIGEMCLELDPSRTRVLPTSRNQQIINKLDVSFISFISGLHNRYWSSLPKESLLEVYSRLAGILRIESLSFSLRWNDALIPLIDMFLENMPLETIQFNERRTLYTWDEIRSLGKPVVFFRNLKLPNIDERLDNVTRALPGAIIVIEDPSRTISSLFFNISTLSAVHVSDFCKMSFKVLKPWQGNALQLKEQMTSTHIENRIWDFIIPFVPSQPYAIISSTTQRMSGGVEGWINSAHPKISDFLKAVIEAEKRKIDTIQSKQFLFFVHRNHIGLGNDPDYVLYIQDHQRLALNELVAAGILKENEAEKLLLTSEDFVPWERDY